MFVSDIARQRSSRMVYETRQRVIDIQIMIWNNVVCQTRYKYSSDGYSVIHVASRLVTLRFQRRLLFGSASIV